MNFWHSSAQFSTSDAGQTMRLGRACAALLHGQQVAQHLHRLAQTHIVGQDAAHAVAVQRPQPAVAIALVLSQTFCREAGGVYSLSFTAWKLRLMRRNASSRLKRIPLCPDSAQSRLGAR